MPKIDVLVRDKVATTAAEEVVCGNSDYIIAFDFDEEWVAYETKTARFSYNGRYQDVVFTGSECPMPVIHGTAVCQIGVYAGDLHTTTPALLWCKKSILCEGGVPADPPEDVYNQIMERLNSGASGEGGGDNFIEKVWENASPSSDFAAQTVALDLTDYDGVSFLYRNEAGGSSYLSTGFVPIGYRTPMWFMPATTAERYIRNATINSDGIEFASGQAGTKVNEKFCIPICIYGIKGVS